MEYLQDETHKKWMAGELNKLMESILPYFREDGYFSWQLGTMEGPKDTSATARIGYAMKKVCVGLSKEFKETVFCCEDQKEVLLIDMVKKIEEESKQVDLGNSCSCCNCSRCIGVEYIHH